MVPGPQGVGPFREDLMKKRLLIIPLLLNFLFACSPLVIPKATPDGEINPADNSITKENDSLRIAARAQDLEVAPYRMVDNVTSFYLVIENLSDNEISIPLDSIVLIDGDGNQFRPIPPSEVQKITSRDSTYLIPYPYVGFYYLEDQVQYSATNALDSSLPYHYENYPQDLYTEALPAGTILPGAQITGVVYFLIDLYTKKDIEIRIYRPGTPTSGPPDFSFPFTVEK